MTNDDYRQPTAEEHRRAEEIAHTLSIALEDCPDLDIEVSITALLMVLESIFRWAKAIGASPTAVREFARVNFDLLLMYDDDAAGGVQ